MGVFVVVIRNWHPDVGGPIGLLALASKGILSPEQYQEGQHQSVVLKSLLIEDHQTWLIIISAGSVIFF